MPIIIAIVGVIILIWIAYLLIKFTFKLQDGIYDQTSEYRKKANGKPFCPNCGSTYLSANNRGYSMVTGTIGSKDVYVTCIKCGHRWKAGQYNYLYIDK